MYGLNQTIDVYTLYSSTEDFQSLAENAASNIADDLLFNSNGSLHFTIGIK